MTIEKKNSFNFINRGLEKLISDRNNTNMQENRVHNVIQQWPNGTTLITGSSILLGVEESRLKKYKAKVRAFPGATVDDMFDYLLPLLKKIPTNIILHIGSNDSSYKSSNEIAGEISTLKEFIHCMVNGGPEKWPCNTVCYLAFEFLFRAPSFVWMIRRRTRPYVI